MTDKCSATGFFCEMRMGDACTLGSPCPHQEPLTNEEWLHTLNTEQKAEWIAKQKCDGCNDEPYDDKHGTCKYCMTKKTEQIREWLKQPHPNE